MNRLIILMGAPGTGKTSQSEMIKTQFCSSVNPLWKEDQMQVTVIESGRLLRKMSRDQSDSRSALTMEERKLIRDLFNSGKITTMLPGEILAKCIIAEYGPRICSQSDDDDDNDNDDDKGECKEGNHHLFLYYRGPSTVDMATCLIDQWNIVPDMVIILDAKDEILVERVCQRRIDPVTRKTYHLTYDPPPANQPAVLDRLMHRLGDEEEIFTMRLSKYRKQTEKLTELYRSKLPASRIRHVDASEDREHVFHLICGAITEVFQIKSE